MSYPSLTHVLPKETQSKANTKPSVTMCFQVLACAYHVFTKVDEVLPKANPKATPTNPQSNSNKSPKQLQQIPKATPTKARRGQKFAQNFEQVVRREFFSYTYVKEMIMDVKSLSISGPTPTAVDSLNLCRIRCGQDDAVWSSKEEVETPFTPSSFNEVKANKQNLDIRCIGDYLQFFSELDRWALEYVVVNSVRLFGKKLTREKAAAMYRPCIKKIGTFDPLLRTKLTLEGQHRTIYWTMAGEDRNKPECWQATVFKTRIRIGYLYITESTFGLALECTDVQVCKEFTPAPLVCPF